MKAGLLQKLVNCLGFDSHAVLLKQAVVRKDKEAVTNLIAGLRDPNSVNRNFTWKKVNCPNALVGSSPLDFALALGDTEIMELLLNSGATFNPTAVTRAAVYILQNQSHPDIKKYIKVCEDHKVDWSKGLFYKRVGEKVEYYATAEMMLLITLKQKAFELGLFSEEKAPAVSVEKMGNINVVEMAKNNEVVINNTVLKI